MSSEIEGLSQVEGSLIQIDDGHVKPGAKNKPCKKLSSEMISRKKTGDSLVHLGVQGPDGVTQMHSCIKEHFHIEQIVNT